MSDNNLTDYSNNKENYANRKDNVNSPSSNVNVNNTNTSKANLNSLSKEEFLVVKNILLEQPQNNENVKEDDPDNPDFVHSVDDLMHYSSSSSDMDVASNINNNNENLHNVETDHEENIIDEGGEGVLDEF